MGAISPPIAHIKWTRHSLTGKMKKLFFLFLSFVAIALVTVSCDKDRPDYRPRVASSTQNANAYEYIGEQHNQGLDYFLQNGDFHDIRKQAAPITIQFGEKLGYKRADMEATLSDPSVADVIYSDAPDVTLSAYYKAHGLTKELAYFNQMSAALSAESATAAEAVAKLTEIERAVETDKSLSAKSQISLLQGLAVGKHSAEYWYEQSLLGKSSPWIIKSGQSGGSPQARINWWKVGLMDLAGGLTGGVIGGLAGSIISVAGQL